MVVGVVAGISAEIYKLGLNGQTEIAERDILLLPFFGDRYHTEGRRVIAVFGKALGGINFSVLKAGTLKKIVKGTIETVFYILFLKGEPFYSIFVCFAV